MERTGKITTWALIGLFLAIGAEAVTPEAAVTQYQGIADRNVFNLRPPPPRENAPQGPPPQPPPKVTLDGISTFTGAKLAYLTVPPTKPGTPAQTLMLAEEQAQDDVEVTQIDEKGGVVKIINHGEAQSLDFDHNGTKPEAPASGGTLARPMTIPPPAPPNGQPAPFPNVIRPLRALPTRNAAGPFGSGGEAVGGNVSSVTSEQQDMLIEAQRMKALQENDPIAGILPPTSHTQEIESGVAGAQQ